MKGPNGCEDSDRCNGMGKFWLQAEGAGTNAIVCSRHIAGTAYAIREWAPDAKIVIKMKTTNGVWK